MLWEISQYDWPNCECGWGLLSDWIKLHSLVWLWNDESTLRPNQQRLCSVLYQEIQDKVQEDCERPWAWYSGVAQNEALLDLGNQSLRGSWKVSLKLLLLESQINTRRLKARKMSCHNMSKCIWKEDLKTRAWLLKMVQFLVRRAENSYYEQLQS